MKRLPRIQGLVEHDGDPAYQVWIDDPGLRRDVARTGCVLYVLEDFVRRHVDPSMPLPARLSGHVSRDRAWLEIVPEHGLRKRYIVEIDWPKQ